jgi:hypothetical protein
MWTWTSNWTTGINTYDYNTGECYNTGWWNNVRYTAGVVPVTSWGNQELEYRRDGQSWAYADDNKIEVIKGSPAKARYCVFYAKKKDPVIFCRTRRELYKEVKKLVKDKDVDVKSIRIFALIGGAKKVIR